MKRILDEKLPRIITLALVFSSFLSILTYILVSSSQDIESTVLNNSDRDFIEKSVLSSQDDPELSYEIDSDPFDEISMISKKEIINDIDDPIRIVKPLKENSIQMGSSKVYTQSYEFDSPGIYQIDIVDNLSSSLSFAWNHGSLSVGNLKSGLKVLKPTDEPKSIDLENLSELIYGLNDTFLVKVSAPTLLLIDSYSSAVILEEDSFAGTSEIANKNSGAKYSSLPIISRDAWGGATLYWDPYSNNDIDDPARFTWDPGYFRASKIVVHHTVSPNTADDPARAVRDIYLYHAYSRGWGDVGYHYLIDKWGNIYEGKGGGDEVYGYHAYTEANRMGIAIALIGNFENEVPTTAQKDSLARLIAEKSVFYGFGIASSNGTESSWLSSNVTVYGHKDTWFWCYTGHPLDHFCPSGDMWARNSTACPGTYLESALASEIVPKAKYYVDRDFWEIKEAVLLTNQTLSDAPADIDSFIVTYNLPENVDKSTIESKIPAHSGIASYEVFQNQVTINVGDWNGSVIVPPVGWNGTPSGTFFPPSAGPKDRIETLMKIFLLDPEVKNVGVMNKYSISPIE